MSSSNLIRGGGPAALLGGLLFVVYAVGISLVTAYNPALKESSAGHAIYHLFNAPPNALMFIGIVALYLFLRRSDRFGLLEDRLLHLRGCLRTGSHRRLGHHSE